MKKTPFSWTCPYCGQATTIMSVNYSAGSHTIDTAGSEYPDLTIKSYAIRCPNPDCEKLELRCKLYTNKHITVGMGKALASVDLVDSWKLMPQSIAKPIPDYVPKAIRDNYKEACLILDLSPKASAAMSRRCLQGIIRDFWDIPQNKRGNLGAEISYIKDQVDPDTYESIKAVREVGDIGAHMEKAVDTIVDVEPEEATLLVQLIETLIDDWYVAKHKRAARNQGLRNVVTGKRAAKKVSKASTTQIEGKSGNAN